MCSLPRTNNVIWKFNKNQVYPKTLLRTENSVILGLKENCVSFKHFRPSSGEEAWIGLNLTFGLREIDYFTVRDNILTQSIHGCPPLPDPLYGKEHAVKIYILGYDEKEDTVYNAYDEVPVTFRYYVQEVANAVAEKLAKVVIDKYQSLGFFQTIKLKINSDHYFLYDNLYLSEGLAEIMHMHFYDPANKDNNITARTINNIFLLFRIE